MAATKRQRKANFTAEEVSILLEGIQLEKLTLFSCHSAGINNEIKKEVWSKIAFRVNACGVAVRTVYDVKEKWRALKASALNKKREEAKTGGGSASAPVPYEDVILSIIGDNSNVLSGVTGQDDNFTSGFDSFVEPKDVSVLPDTMHLDADQSRSQWSDSDTGNNITTTADNTVSFIQVKKEDGGSVLVPLTTSSHHSPSPPMPVTPETSQRRMSENPVMFHTDNSELVDEWLKSQIEESKVKKQYYELKTRKVLLELEKLEKG